jgi:hypothetical protein
LCRIEIIQSIKLKILFEPLARLEPPAAMPQFPIVYPELLELLDILFELELLGIFELL